MPCPRVNDYPSVLQRPRENKYLISRDAADRHASIIAAVRFAFVYTFCTSSWSSRASINLLTFLPVSSSTSSAALGTWATSADSIFTPAFSKAALDLGE